MNCGLFLSGKPRAFRAGSFTWYEKCLFRNYHWYAINVKEWGIVVCNSPGGLKV